jgi:hypothetical protein
VKVFGQQTQAQAQTKKGKEEEEEEEEEEEKASETDSEMESSQPAYTEGGNVAKSKEYVRPGVGNFPQSSSPDPDCLRGRLEVGHTSKLCPVKSRAARHISARAPP